ncbi:MAG: serine/threonine-protein kinase [Synechococcales bacterium]|nr:serine/threonine-protein kinase [Synechococcales bacterium]
MQYLVPPMTDTPDDILDNRYQLLELVGKGAMGRVYKARDLRLGGAIVAIKFLSQTLLNQRMRDRFWTEASICAQLGQKSIHIVRVMDYGVHDDVPYYVMEYLQGDSLSDLIRQQPLSLKQFIKIIRQICLGLQAAHQGIEIDGKRCPIIHRDIKPSNMLVVKDTSLGELVKVLDFGISRVLQEDADVAQQTSTYMGTMVYSSPEQMEGRELTVLSDCYSLGIMMFEMLSSKLPIQAETHSFGGWHRAHSTQAPRSFQSINPTLRIPKLLENLIQDCLAKNPKDRPQSMVEILKAIESLDKGNVVPGSLTDRIEQALDRHGSRIDPVDHLTSGSRPRTTSLTEELYRTAIWTLPTKGNITFCAPLKVLDRTIPAMYAMLPFDEIKTLKLKQPNNRVYKNFLCCAAPYPLIVSITGIYNRFCHDTRPPRWLHPFIDMNTPQGKLVLQLLGEKGIYYILLFAEEAPHKCAFVIEVAINAQLQSQLQEWSILSNTWQVAGDAATYKQAARNSLKNELDKIKARINPELMTPPLLSP